MQEDRFEFGRLVEQYRLWIGGIIVLLILVGAGILYYREIQAQLPDDERIAMLERRVAELEQRSATISQDTTIRDSLATVESEALVREDAVSPVGQSVASGQIKGATTGLTQRVAGKININTASVAELDRLPGIGPVYAERIVEYRTSNGGFKTVEEIQKVKGIGPKTFEKFRDQVVTE